MKKLVSIILSFILLNFVASFVLYANEMEEVHEFDDILAELNSEDLNVEIRELNRITKKITDKSIAISKSDIEVPEFKEIDENAELSTRISAITDMFIIYKQFNLDVLEAKDVNEQNALEITSYVAELFEHMGKVSKIIKKIEKSANENVSIALAEWKKVAEDNETLQKQLEIDRVLAEKLAEEVAALSKVKNRVRKAAYVELGIGLPTLILGCLPIWTDEQKNIQNLLLGIGGSLTTAGGVSFVFTITF